MTQTFLLPVITSTGHTAQIAGTFSFSDGPNGHIVFGQMSDIDGGRHPGRRSARLWSSDVGRRHSHGAFLHGVGD